MRDVVVRVVSSGVKDGEIEELVAKVSRIVSEILVDEFNVRLFIDRLDGKLDASEEAGALVGIRVAGEEWVSAVDVNLTVAGEKPDDGDCGPESDWARAQNAIWYFGNVRMSESDEWHMHSHVSVPPVLMANRLAKVIKRLA